MKEIIESWQISALVALTLALWFLGPILISWLEGLWRRRDITKNYGEVMSVRASIVLAYHTEEMLDSMREGKSFTISKECEQALDKAGRWRKKD